MIDLVVYVGAFVVVLLAIVNLSVLLWMRWIARKLTTAPEQSMRFNIYPMV